MTTSSRMRVKMLLGVNPTVPLQTRTWGLPILEKRRLLLKKVENQVQDLKKEEFLKK